MSCWGRMKEAAGRQELVARWQGPGCDPPPRPCLQKDHKDVGSQSELD